MKTKMVIAIAGLLLLPEVAASNQLLFPPAVASNSASSSSWFAGAQMGYNWQRGSLIYGFEADVSGLDLDSQMNTTLPRNTLGGAFPAPTAITNSTIDWYGTVRGRLGWATGPLMFYGTGGLAYGHTGVNSTLSDNLFPLSLNTQSSSVKTGWVAGVGVDYLLRPDLILNLGYQYVDLGSTGNTGSSPTGSLQQTINTRGQFQAVSVGLSWLFQPAGGSAIVDGPKYAKAVKAPVVAPSPWEGLYVGGHAGGAWGNHTDANYSDDTIIPPSDIRLKRDIQLVGRRDDGLGLYSYRYLWSDTVYVGVMAQEVALVHPDAIVRGQLDDYLRVDYSRLGMKLMMLSDWEAKRDAL